MRNVAAIVAAGGLIACQHVVAVREPTDQELVEIASNYLGNPDVLKKSVAEVKRDSHFWFVSFQLKECVPPANCIGGPDVLVIDKSTRRVVQVIVGQ